MSVFAFTHADAAECARDGTARVAKRTEIKNMIQMESVEVVGSARPHRHALNGQFVSQTRQCTVEGRN